MLSKTDKELMEQAVTLYQSTINDWQENHREMVEDTEFTAGEQPNTFFGKNQQIYNENNPNVPVDLLSTPLAHIENILRKTDISMAVHKGTSEIDDDLLEIIQSKLKAISVDSDDKQQISKACGRNGQLVPGLGFFRVYTEYVSPTSFNQKIKFKGVSDIFKILPDYHAEDNTFADARYWFEYEVYTKEEYEEIFGKPAEVNSVPSPTGENQSLVSSDSVTVIKYWYRDTKRKTLYEFPDGSTSEDKDAGPIVVSVDEVTGEKTEMPAPPIRKRTVQESSVHWLTTNGVEVLAKGKWHNDEFPFVAVCGNVQWVNGKKKIYGAIRKCKQSQLMYNFYNAQIAKRLATSSIAPWLASDKQVGDESVRALFNRSHYEPVPLLIYKSVSDGAFPVPPPARADLQQPEIQQTLLALQQCRQDIMASIGLFDAGMANTNMQNGQQVNPSGIAIQTLSQQGEVNNLQYTANMVSSIKRLCTIIMNLFPIVYDTPREELIVGEDGKHKAVWINKPFIDTETGQTKYYDFSNIRHDVLDVQIDVGPSYANAQSELVDKLTAFATAIPNGMVVIGDVIARNMDYPGHDIVAERITALQSTMFPQIAQMEKMDQAKLPPQARTAIASLQGQLQQQLQIIQKLQQENQKLTFSEQAKILDNTNKMKIAVLQAQTTLEQERMELIKEQKLADSKERIEMIKAQLSELEHRREMLLDIVKHNDEMQKSHLAHK